MINSLSIQNFQSHKETKLEFDNGINIIIGQSDSGKSATLRALNWVINNKPSGEAFRSSWGGDTQIELKLEDDGEVLRYKTKKVPNGYQVHYPTKMKRKTGDVAGSFRSFGQDVPEEIKDILNFSPLNMAGQFDSPFLLAMSGGEVARYLNKIVHLDVIDKSLSNIGRVLTKEKADLKYKEQDYREAKEKEREFDWLEGTEGELVALEQHQGMISDRKKSIDRLARLCLHIEQIGDQLSKLPDLSKYEDEVEKLIREQGEIIIQKQAMNRLKDMLENLRQLDNAISDIGGGVKCWEKDFKELFPEQCPLCGRRECEKKKAS